MANTRKPLTDLDREIGNLVREARVCLGLTQAQLARRVGVSVVQMNKYENGNCHISINRLVEICLQMNIDPTDIFREAISETHRNIAIPAERSVLELAKKASMLSPDTRAKLSALTAHLAEIEA